MRNCDFAYTYPTKKNYGKEIKKKSEKNEKSVTNASLRSAPMTYG